jgi:hypothetical protein
VQKTKIPLCPHHSLGAVTFAPTAFILTTKSPITLLLTPFAQATFVPTTYDLTAFVQKTFVLVSLNLNVSCSKINGFTNICSIRKDCFQNKSKFITDDKFPEHMDITTQ